MSDFSPPQDDPTEVWKRPLERPGPGRTPQHSVPPDDHSGRCDLNCAEFEQRVQDLLDCRLRPQLDGEVSTHAGNCPGCARLLKDFLLLETALRYDGSASSELEHAPPDNPVSAEPEINDGLDNRINLRDLSRQPRHPASREQQTRVTRQAGAAVVLCGLGILAVVGLGQRSQQATMVPVTRGAASTELASAGEIPSDSSASLFLEGRRPAGPYRSLEQCYELTSELPGVKPLRASILVALDWWQQYFSGQAGSESSASHHERGFGLNPSATEARFRV